MLTWAQPDAASITEEEARIIADACPDGGVIVETGTFLGMGTRRIAEAAPHARVVTVEHDDEIHALAAANLADVPNVECVHANAYEWEPAFDIDVLVLDDTFRHLTFEHLTASRVFCHDGAMKPILWPFMPAPSVTHPTHNTLLEM